MVDGLSTTSLQNMVQNHLRHQMLKDSEPYTISVHNDRAVIYLKKPEAIYPEYNEDFIPKVSALLHDKGKVEINCGRKSHGGDFIAEELCSKDIKTKIYRQDHAKPENDDSFDFTVSIKPSIGFFDSPELENVIIVIEKLNKPTPEDKCKIPSNNSSNNFFISNISTTPCINNNPMVNLSDNFIIDRSSKINEIDFPAESFRKKPNNQVAGDAAALVFQEYTNSKNIPVGSTIISSNSGISKEEIILEGYGFGEQWSDEFEKAMSFIDKGKCVILRKDDPSGIEDAIKIELRRGISRDEILIDFMCCDEIQCSDILPYLLSHLLNEGRSVAIDYGYIISEELEKEIDESLLPDIPPDTSHYIEERKVSEGNFHAVLILKKDSEG